MDDFKITNPLQSTFGATAGSKPQTPSGPLSFGQMLTDSIDKVNRQQLEADTSIANLVTGKHTDIHQTMIAMEKASVSFELMMQIRNKIVAAYENIMRTPI